METPPRCGRESSDSSLDLDMVGPYEPADDDDPFGPGFRRGSASYHSPGTPRSGSPVPPAPRIQAPKSPLSPASALFAGFDSNDSSNDSIAAVEEGVRESTRGPRSSPAVPEEPAGMNQVLRPGSASSTSPPRTPPKPPPPLPPRTPSIASESASTAVTSQAPAPLPTVTPLDKKTPPQKKGSPGSTATVTPPRIPSTYSLKSASSARSFSTRALKATPSAQGEEAMESDLDFIRELKRYQGERTDDEDDAYEFALVLKPNDEYRDAVEVLELALDLRDGAVGASNASPQKLDDARRVRESLVGIQAPSGLLGDSMSGAYGSQSNLLSRRAGPPQVRPGLSEGLEGKDFGGRRQRLSLLDDLQEAEGRLTHRRKKELERKKKNRLFHFAGKMREGVIVRRHVAHHTCEQVVLQSTDDCRTITCKPLLAARQHHAIFKSLRGPRMQRAESISTAHISAVIPATDPDPSHPGFFGTRALRLSEDIPNPARTFSLLYGDWGLGNASGGKERKMGDVTGTLDLECDDDGMFAMLFQGFLLLHMQMTHAQAGPAPLSPTMASRARAITASTPGRPTAAASSKPPAEKNSVAVAALDNMEAGSSAWDRVRWSLRKVGSDLRDKIFRENSACRVLDLRENTAGGSGSTAGRLVAGSVASFRKPLKILPELFGAMSTSKQGRRGAQQGVGVAPPEFFLGWTSPGTQIWSRLRMAGLQVEKLYSLDRRHVMLKIKLPRKKLEEVAETMRLKLRRRDGTIAHFRINRRSSFTGNVGSDLFRSGESQKVIDHLVRAKIKDGGAELDDRTELAKHICKRMPLHNQARLEALYNAWVVYWRAPYHQLAQQREQHRQQQKQLKQQARRRELHRRYLMGDNVLHQIPGLKIPAQGVGIGAGARSYVGGSVKKAGQSPGVRGGFKHFDGDDEMPTRGEVLRERGAELWELVIAAINFCVVVLKGSLWQPLELIADYYGEATAFYFAWMGFYTQGLIIPSIIGVIVFFCQVHARSLDHPIIPTYAAFVLVWSSALLVLWRQRCSELAYRWGVLHFEQEEQTRSQFRGVKVRDNVTGVFVPEYPAWKRWATYAITMPIMIAFTGGVLTFMFMVFDVREDASKEERTRADPKFWARMLISPMLYGIMIPILYQGCKKLGVFLNNLENHKTENKYRNALIVKVFSFRFVTVFASLYYFAFLSRDMKNDYRLFRLAASLCTFMTIGQWWYMIWMCYIPARLQRWRLRTLEEKVAVEREKLNRADEAEAAGVGGGSGAGEARRGVRRKLLDEAGDHLWKEALLKEYNMDDAFDDYTMSLIQFAYVALFSAAFPLAPLLAMINNLVQTRVDAFKLCKTRRRPIALKSSGIGVWDNVLQLMTVVAVITNCALVGVTSTHLWAQDVSPATRILVVVIAEHVVLFMKYWLESSVPRIPHKVQRALQRERAGREQKGLSREGSAIDLAKCGESETKAQAASPVSGKLPRGDGGRQGAGIHRGTKAAGVAVSPLKRTGSDAVDSDAPNTASTVASTPERSSSIKFTSASPSKPTPSVGHSRFASGERSGRENNGSPSPPGVATTPPRSR